MTNHILNIINSLLAYSDPTVTDNPHQRAFDHTRRLDSIAVNNPLSNYATLAPGASVKLFDGTVASGLTGSSVLSLSLLSGPNSIYRLSVTSGPSAFKTARTPSGIVACTVTVNNNAVVDFDFTAATLTGIVSGDIMRVKGPGLYDIGPFAFNPLNTGLWKIIGISGTKVSCTRLPGQAFEAAAEVVAVATADVSFYADDGIRKGNKMEITGTLSPASRRTYEVLDVTPTSIDFVSAMPLPVETGLTYVSGTITVYVSSKKLVSIEVDQECVVRFNADTSDNNKVSPIAAGNSLLVGFLSKWGDSYSCEIVNKSLNACNVKFFTTE
jgi:hypothetical protein